jgi:glycosyltransferase 2 family protein
MEGALLHRLGRWLVRRWLLWVLIIALLAVLISRRVAIEELLATLRQGAWPWIVAATLLQVLYYVLYALLFQQAFATVRVQSRVRDLLPVVLAANFVNNLAPSAGITGAALYIGSVARRGQSAVRATEGVLLEIAVESLALVPVLLGGLADLRLRHVLATYQAVGALLYLAYTVLLSAALLLAHWSPHYLLRLLRWLQALANRIARALGRPILLSVGWSERNAAELHGATDAIVQNPRQVGRTLAVALATQLANLATLYALFRAFHHAVSLGTLAAGYALGMVFAVISFLPYDIGVLQGVMALVYDSLGVPASTAVAVVLAFGGINAWLPLLLGFFFLRQLRTRHPGGSATHRP